jgi:hypothetical protein
VGGAQRGAVLRARTGHQGREERRQGLKRGRSDRPAQRGRSARTRARARGFGAHEGGGGGARADHAAVHRIKRVWGVHTETQRRMRLLRSVVSLRARQHIG